MYSEKELEEHSKWNWWTIGLLILAFIALIFSFFAPKLLVQPSKSEALDFSRTGQIGDTIGGIMNPFVAITGVILTFLAFWIQFQANKLQYKQNVNNRERDFAEKKKEKDEYLKDNLRLVHFDLKEIIRDVKSNLPLLKNFYEMENSKPVQTNILKRTAQSGSFKNVLEMNRLVVFNAFQRYIPKDSGTLFGRYQSTLEHLSALFENLHLVLDNHVTKKFEELTSIVTDLKVALDLASGMISKKDVEPISPEVLDLLNKLISEYYLVINEALDENGNIREQTNLVKLSETALKNFLVKSLSIKKNDLGKYDFRLEEIEKLISSIRKRVFKVRQDSLKVAQEVKEQYDQLLHGIQYEGDESLNQESILSTLESLEKAIGEALEQNTIKKDKVK
ncbi:hypothetical protein LAG90_00830 [Marinilongibacter aquaticus]|uniref:hypothetical protein n=1 Tax=Marinilongibacter aquaticus TaxID=2975157 RepID=UPI0021BD0FE5|nr:hypothetical protein [Marinilongibacter aquaticus]UBM59203.1 hypothetical protein LAG90_00830 [Marinilongibacter aquaticus]